MMGIAVDHGWTLLSVQILCKDRGDMYNDR